jgi:hypothetical protein
MYSGVQEDHIRDAATSALQKMTPAPDSLKPADGLGEMAKQQALLPGPAEFAKALGEFAKGMAGLARSVQVFLVATLLFFLAAAAAGAVALK